MYESTDVGKSKLMTLQTFWKSTPLETPYSLSFVLQRAFYKNTFLTRGQEEGRCWETSKRSNLRRKLGELNGSIRLWGVAYRTECFLISRGAHSWCAAACGSVRHIKRIEPACRVSESCYRGGRRKKLFSVCLVTTDSHHR